MIKAGKCIFHAGQEQTFKTNGFTGALEIWGRQEQANSSFIFITVI